MQRGSTPRVYRNTLVFLSAEARQLDGLKDAVRSALAWESIVKDDKRLDLKKSDIALAEAKLAEAKDTMKTRLRECWCYLIYPHQEDAQSDVEWSSSKIPAQDGLLSRASKKLASDEGLLPELGPTRLDRDLQRYIWNGKPHLLLRDLWEYLNRYTYLPRLKDQTVLVKAVQAAVSGMLPGPFAYAEKWDESSESYLGLLIDKAASPHIVVDRDSVLIKPDVAEAHRPTPTKPGETPLEEGSSGGESGPTTQDEEHTTTTEPGEKEKLPTRFNGTVMISPDRPARDIHQIVEAIVEQLTTIPGSEVSLKLEIDAEVASGLDRSKVRTLMENAATLGFIDKDIR